MIDRLDGQRDPLRRQTLDEGGGEVASEGWAEYRKTKTIWARQMPKEFEVNTLEGVQTGKARDWLAVGELGEMYPIDSEVFDRTYEPVQEGE